jgi:ABC-2 type transport system permease protein
VKHTKLLVCDEDGSALSRGLVSRFSNTEYFKIVSYVQDPGKIQDAFNHNRVKMALRIPGGFSSKIKKGKKTEVQLIIDGSDPNMTAIALNRGAAIIRNYSEYTMEKKMAILKKIIGDLPSLEVEERVWYNPELKSVNTMVPGVIALIIEVVTLIVTAVSLVREKESGNMEQLLVSPISPFQIIIGKILPYVIIAFLDIVLITVLSIVVFDISFTGSFTLLLALSLFMILANLGFGIFISTVSLTQQQAMVSAIFLTLPSVLLSGFIFPIKNMPLVIQWLTYLIPMRYYVVIVRGIFLKGLNFMELLPQTLALLVFGIIILTLSIMLFKKKLA